MARRRRNRSIGLVAVALVAVTTVVAVFAASRGGGGANAAAADLLRRAAQAKKAAGCDQVRTIGPYGGVSDTSSANYQDQTHIGGSGAFATAPALSTYPSQPPTSGPHDASPLAAGVYDSPPSVQQTLHALEHGATIVWYAPDVSSKQLNDLKAFYRQSTSTVNVRQDRVIVAPYDYPAQGAAGALPSGVQLALVAWHRLQTCTTVSLAGAFDFTSQYASPVYGGRTYKGDAPEPGAQL